MDGWMDGMEWNGIDCSDRQFSNFIMFLALALLAFRMVNPLATAMGTDDTAW
jgi:hypothetical protein